MTTARSDRRSPRSAGGRRYVTILENRRRVPAANRSRRSTIDKRPGSIHVIPKDLNGDAKMDLVVLLAQEHETVLAYINTGKGDFTFEQKVIYAAPHPNWGSSGIAARRSRQGRRPRRPAHARRHLRRRHRQAVPRHPVAGEQGTYPFVEHSLAQMPGVHRAKAADMDGDGDLDIVALRAPGKRLRRDERRCRRWCGSSRPSRRLRAAHDRDGHAAARDARRRRHRRRRRRRHRRRQLLDREAHSGVGGRVDESAEESAQSPSSA